MNRMVMRFLQYKIKYGILPMATALLLLPCACRHVEKVEKSEPIRVRVMTIDTVCSGMVRTYVGEVEEKTSLPLGFAGGGKVERVYVREGDHVRAGQLLVTVNAATARNAYNSAKAQLDQAEDAYKRLKKVYDQGSLAEVKWVEMLTTLEKARSLEQIAKKQLADCELYAPASGVIGKCNAVAGVSLMPGEPAVTLLDMKEVAAVFTVPENEIDRIPVGRTATILIPALENMTLEGKVTEKSMTSNPGSHSYKVKVSLPNAKGKFLPGMVCKVYMEQSDQMGYVVPAKAVQTRPEGLAVWTVSHGKACRRLISSTEYVADGVLVKEGLRAGDTIVTEGYQKLYNQAPVVCE